MVRAFIDSNVIANWIMIDEKWDVVNKIKNETKKRKEEVRFREKIKKYSYQRASYDFLEKVKVDTTSEHILFVSNLVFNEVISVMLEEYVAKKLISKHIPIRFWSKHWNTYKEKTELYYKDGKDIVDGLNQFIDTFVDTDKIKSAKEVYDKQAIVELIIVYKQDTHDSSIIGIAIANKCDYLITEDKRLREDITKKKYNKIKLISSDEFRVNFLNP